MLFFAFQEAPAGAALKEALNNQNIDSGSLTLLVTRLQICGVSG